MEEFKRVLRKEFRLAARSGYEVFMPIMYLFLIIIFFNISTSYISKKITLELVPQMIWLSCLLVCILNLEAIFREDFEDGSLDYFLTADVNHESQIIAKILSHWSLTVLPVVIASPFISLLLGINIETSLVLFLSLLIGTPSLSLIGSIIAAITLTLKRGKVLLSIIVLPMFVPILIFGSSAVNNSMLKINYDSELLLLGIVFFIFLLISPFACLRSLKVSLD